MYKIEIPRQIGQTIKSKRLERDLTQEQLAKLTNTSRSLIYRLEKGTTNGISLEKLFEILKALDLELAIIDLNNKQKIIQKITMDSSAHDDQAQVEKTAPTPAFTHKATTKKDSIRNSQAQREKELEAIRNIRTLNAKKR